MQKVILFSLFLCFSVQVSFQKIVEIDHAANFTIEPRDGYKSGIKPSLRIIGGSNANMNEYPWMVALCEGKTCSFESQFCGATLLTKKYILTAAHCIEDRRAWELSVSVGDHNINSNSETSNQDLHIEKIIKHKKYNETTYFNDIALLKVKGKVKFNGRVLPACLPNSKAQYANKIATTTGWGTISSEGQYSKVLKEVRVRVLNNKVCRKIYGGEFTAGMLCAGGKKKDSCQGDSGGPLVLKNRYNKGKLIGVVSWGYDCGSTGFPGLYARVSYYMGWIKKNIGGKSYCSA